MIFQVFEPGDLALYMYNPIAVRVRVEAGPFDVQGWAGDNPYYSCEVLENNVDPGEGGYEFRKGSSIFLYAKDLKFLSRPSESYVSRYDRDFQV